MTNGPVQVSIDIFVADSEEAEDVIRYMDPLLAKYSVVIHMEAEAVEPVQPELPFILQSDVARYVGETFREDVEDQHQRIRVDEAAAADVAEASIALTRDYLKTHGHRGMRG
jgi:hypothetical protein